jgi:hypothetical protein
VDNLKLIEALSHDRALASAMLFEHRHGAETAPYQIEMMDELCSPEESVLLEAFRYGAKTTVSEEVVIEEACFQNFKYQLLIGETYEKACDRISNIKYEFVHNDKINKIFGKQKGDVWRENEVVLKNGVKIEGFGWDQEIRGFKYLQWRPDRVLCDDIENRVMVRDVPTVDINWRRFHRELLPAVDKNARIRILGTPLAAYCMIVKFRASRFWRCRQFPICNGPIDDPRTEATWPGFFPMEWIRRQRDKFQEAGELSSSIRNICSRRTPRTGKVVVSFAGSKIVCHQSSGHFWMPDEIQGDIIETTREHRPLWVGVEKNSLDEWLLQPLRAKMLSTGTFVPLVPMNAPQDQDKDSFIMSLQPFIASGDLVLVGGLNAHPDLVEEIRNFPTGKKDVINALALSMRLKPGLAVYPDFGPENILEHFTPHPILPWHLVANATGSENCFALMQIDGLHMHVFRDWVLPGTPDDAIKRMSADIRLYYPKADKIEVWAPSDAHDNWARSQLIPALRRFKTTASRGEYVARARGALTDLIRTSAGDHRLLTCSPEAWQTINALSGGYCAQLRPDGRVSDQPVSNHYKTLAEAIESLAAFINQGIGSLTEIPGARYAVSSDGKKYISSLPERRPR